MKNGVFWDVTPCGFPTGRERGAIRQVVRKLRSGFHPLRGTVSPQPTAPMRGGTEVKHGNRLGADMHGKRNCEMKNAVVWDVTPCGSCKNRRFERT
jgi:hypothetical protein